MPAAASLLQETAALADNALPMLSPPVSGDRECARLHRFTTVACMACIHTAAGQRGSGVPWRSRSSCVTSLLPCLLPSWMYSACCRGLPGHLWERGIRRASPRHHPRCHFRADPGGGRHAAICRWWSLLPHSSGVNCDLSCRGRQLSVVGRRSAGFTLCPHGLAPRDPSLMTACAWLGAPSHVLQLYVNVHTMANPGGTFSNRHACGHQLSGIRRGAPCGVVSCWAALPL